MGRLNCAHTYTLSNAFLAKQKPMKQTNRRLLNKNDKKKFFFLFPSKVRLKERFLSFIYYFCKTLLTPKKYNLFSLVQNLKFSTQLFSGQKFSQKKKKKTVFLAKRFIKTLLGNMSNLLFRFPWLLFFSHQLTSLLLLTKIIFRKFFFFAFSCIVRQQWSHNMVCTFSQ